MIVTQCPVCFNKNKRSDETRARPKKLITKSTFEKLCELQCTQSEICAVLDVSDKTLNAWCKAEYNMSFSEVFRIKREKGKTSLRRAQWALAKKDSRMAIFLGKQYLEQKDKPEAESAVESVLKNIETLAEAVMKTAPNRNIEDLE